MNVNIQYEVYCDWEDCRHQILPGERFVRLKKPGQEAYFHFHSDAPEGELCCWEKFELKKDIERHARPR